MKMLYKKSQVNRCLSAILLAYIIVLSVDAQVYSGDSTNIKRNSVYLELGGLGLFYSINYDHIILNKGPNKDSVYQGIGLRAGFSTFKMGIIHDPSRTTLLPLEAYFFFGNKFNAELGVSNIFIFAQGSGIFCGQTIRLGGKYRGPKGFIIFGGGCVLFNIFGNGGDPYPYLGFGYSF